MRERSAVIRTAIGLLAALLLAAVWPAAASAAAPAPGIDHVFVIVLENESASTTFGPNSPAPYLSQTLRSEGAYVPNYYGIGHQSNDNYIAMISGQAPNPQNQSDCQIFDNFTPGTTGAYGQAQGSGCVFPSSVPTIANQLDSAGLTWRDYNEDMGADPTREAGECAHPGIDQQDNTQKATAEDQYATRHNPFVYFHSIIDDTTLCDTHVVNLNLLPQDLASAADTPNYVFITPDLCNDGHDSPCANGQPGGLAQADSFLRTWVPKIMGSPAFKTERGLLLITFDEAATSNTSSCCGEIPGPNSPRPGISGPGGGDVGAVLLSPCIAPGTVSQQAYNHYSMLRSVEDQFGLSHLGYAALPGERSFGSDVFTRPCPEARIRVPALASSASATPRVRVRWSATPAAGARFTVQVAPAGRKHLHWRTLRRSTTRHSLRYKGRTGTTYLFRVRAKIGNSGLTPWAQAQTVMPSGVKISGGRYSGPWHLIGLRGAWEHQAMTCSSHRCTFTLRYRGGPLSIIGERTPHAGRARVTLDGHPRIVDLHARRTHTRTVIYVAPTSSGRHRLSVRVLSGTVRLEGFAITR